MVKLINRYFFTVLNGWLVCIGFIVQIGNHFILFQTSQGIGIWFKINNLTIPCCHKGARTLRRQEGQQTHQFNCIIAHV
jgi:hypothetical protein